MNLSFLRRRLYHHQNSLGISIGWLCSSANLGEHRGCEKETKSIDQLFWALKTSLEPGLKTERKLSFIQPSPPNLMFINAEALSRATVISRRQAARALHNSICLWITRVSLKRCFLCRKRNASTLCRVLTFRSVLTLNQRAARQVSASSLEKSRRVKALRLILYSANYRGLATAP